MFWIIIAVAGFYCVSSFIGVFYLGQLKAKDEKIKKLESQIAESEARWACIVDIYDRESSNKKMALKDFYVTDDEVFRYMQSSIAVGRPVTRPPPHRSRRAEFPHRAPQSYSHRMRSCG